MVNSDKKFLLSKSKSGYTLIEIVVVMGIVALLGMLGFSALLAARDDRLANGAADLVVSEIRQTRNYALETHNVSCADNGTTISPKIWALKITAAGLERWYYTDDPADANCTGWFLSSNLNQDPSVRVTLNGTPSVGGLLFAFNSPYGKYYQEKIGAVTGLFEADGTTPLPAAADDVLLFQSKKPDPATTDTDPGDATKNASRTVTFIKGLSSTTITINPTSGQVKR